MPVIMDGGTKTPKPKKPPKPKPIPTAGDMKRPVCPDPSTEYRRPS
jgi:hypothetical protein